MTVELKTGDDVLQIPCSESCFFTGITIENYKTNYHTNIAASDDGKIDVFKNAGCIETEHELHDGRMLYLYCYTSDDPEILGIIKKFKGLKMIEFSDENTSITVTL